MNRFHKSLADARRSSGHRLQLSRGCGSDVPHMRCRPATRLQSCSRSGVTMADGMFHLAQFNISRLKAPLDDPSLKEFVDFLDPINAFAEQSPGFVWRLTAADGAAASYLPPSYGDP